MPAIDEMIHQIIEREGGFVNHPNDRGGPTNFGITQATLSRYCGRAMTIDEVKHLSIDVAIEIYRRNYYIAPRLELLPESIQPFIFDSAVNHGPRQAIKFVQRVCNQANYQPALSVDGALGPVTARAAKWAATEMGDIFLDALVEERRNFYLVIVAARPSQQVFLKGWMNRLKDFEREIA